MRSERGLAGTALVIVIAWALTAVLMLTNTLVTAQQIDERVALITNETGSIEGDAKEIQLLNDTNALAGDILGAAKPLSGQLDEVVTSVDSIDTRVKSILGTVESIGGTVDGIHGNVGSILPEVRSIEQGVADINGRAATVDRFVDLIKGDTGHVRISAARILRAAASIDCKVPPANPDGCARAQGGAQAGTTAGSAGKAEAPSVTKKVVKALNRMVRAVTEDSGNLLTGVQALSAGGP